MPSDPLFYLIARPAAFLVALAIAIVTLWLTARYFLREHRLRRGLPKSVYAGTMVALFTLGNTVNLMPCLWLGWHRPEAPRAAAAL